MKNLIVSSGIVLATAAAPGCLAVQVQRVVPGTPGSVNGQRFSLPQTLIQLQVRDDGGREATPMYVPDMAATFALDTPWWRLNSTTEIKTARGMPTTVNIKADDASVLTTALDQAASLAAAQIKAREQQEQDTEKVATDIAAARLEVQLARAEVKSLEGQVAGFTDKTPSAVKEDAMKKLVAANAALAKAESKLAILERRASRADLGARSDALSAKDSADLEPEGRSGPILFQIEETFDQETGRTTSVELKPLATPDIVVEKAKPLGPPKWDAIGTISVDLAVRREVILELKSAHRLGEGAISGIALRCYAPGDDDPGHSVLVLAPGLLMDRPTEKKLRIILPESLAPGRYSLAATVPFVPAVNESPNVHVLMEVTGNAP